MKGFYRFLAFALAAVIFALSFASCSVDGGEVQSDDSSTYEGDLSAESDEKSSSSGKNKSTKPVTNKPDSDAYDYFPVVSEEMPTIHINTPDGSNEWASRYSRNDKLAGVIDYVDATVSIGNCESEFKLSGAEASVKVRGNYTLEYPKKPIRIKFTEKRGVLGLHDGEAYRDWLLLADWKDLSMSHNTVAFFLGNAILGPDGYYCTDFRNVELYLNGKYWGVYLLAEQQEVEENRTSVPETADGYTGTDIGYFFEYDGYYTEERNMPNGLGDPTFTVNYAGLNCSQKGYTVKSAINDPSQLQFLENVMNDSFYIAYQAIFNKKFYEFNSDHSQIVSADTTSVKETVGKVIDLQSLVDIYILNEIVCDADISWSSFYMSLDMTADGNKKITFEAPWDFDSCFGIKKDTCNDAQGLFAARSENPWFKLVSGEEWFFEMVREKWAEMKKNETLKASLDLVEVQRIAYKEHYIRNYQKWEERLNGNGELIHEINSYRDPLTAQRLASVYLYDWLTKRFAYLDGEWTKNADSTDIPTDALRYRYEAEKATLTNGFDGSSIRTNRSYASGSSYVGDVKEGRTITFTVRASRVTDAYLYAGVSKLSESGSFGSWFSVSVNGSALDIPSITVPAISAGEEDWHTFIPVKLSKIRLKEGENTITFTALCNTTNFDYIEVYSSMDLT